MFVDQLQIDTHGDHQSSPSPSTLPSSSKSLFLHFFSFFFNFFSDFFSFSIDEGIAFTSLIFHNWRAVDHLLVENKTFKCWQTNGNQPKSINIGTNLHKIINKSRKILSKMKIVFTLINYKMAIYILFYFFAIDRDLKRTVIEEYHRTKTHFSASLLLSLPRKDGKRRQFIIKLALSFSLFLFFSFESIQNRVVWSRLQFETVSIFVVQWLKNVWPNCFKD